MQTNALNPYPQSGKNKKRAKIIKMHFTCKTCGRYYSRITPNLMNDRINYMLVCHEISTYGVWTGINKAKNTFGQKVGSIILLNMGSNMKMLQHKQLALGIAKILRKIFSAKGK